MKKTQRNSFFRIPTLVVTLISLISTSGCFTNIYYNIESINSPIRPIATMESAVISGTTIDFAYLEFFASNDETQFRGYNVYHGTTFANMKNSTPFECSRTEKVISTTRTFKIQIGGTASASKKFPSICQYTGLVANAGDWVGLEAISNINCSDYPADATCKSKSDLVYVEVAGHVDRPDAILVAASDLGGYHTITVTIPNPQPTNMIGVGVFTGGNELQAINKAGFSTDSADYFCNTTGTDYSGQDIIIQIGGANKKPDSTCYAPDLKLVKDDGVSIRLAVSRTGNQFPWSGSMSVIVP